MRQSLSRSALKSPTAQSTPVIPEGMACSLRPLPLGIKVTMMLPVMCTALHSIGVSNCILCPLCSSCSALTTSAASVQSHALSGTRPCVGGSTRGYKLGLGRTWMNQKALRPPSACSVGLARALPYAVYPNCTSCALHKLLAVNEDWSFLD